MRRVGLRWTIGDVSARGFAALRLSIWGARCVFGSTAAYAVCANTVTPEEARRRTGDVPEGVSWQASDGRVPEFLRRHVGRGMAEGVAWKLAPLRLFPDLYELSLDNDCILWQMPDAVAEWLDSGDERGCVLAADVKPCFGKFADLCGPAPGNTGIRGLGPRFDLAGALAATLARHPVALESELDEQGLQVAALRRHGHPLTVEVDDVTICSPFWPHLPYLGRCGAHFVGLNARALPWRYYDRPASECVAENWERLEPAVRRAVGLRP
jgi:hypothetical protein